MVKLVCLLTRVTFKLFFAFRLYKLSSGEELASPTAVRMRIAPAVIPILSVVFSLARLVSYVGAAVYHALRHQQTAEWKWCLFTVGILSIVSDLLMAGNLSICLWKRWKSQKGLHESSLRRSFSAINRLFVIAIGMILVYDASILLISNTEANLFTWYAL